MISGLERRGFDFSHASALEVFGEVGERSTRFYAPLVASLEVWEIDPACEPGLRRNLPGAKIKITDSFAEIERATGPYDLISIDSPLGGGEHFELFPHVFELLAEDGVIVLNVITRVDPLMRRQFGYLFDEEQLERRRQFYGTDHPDRMSRGELADAYRRLGRGEGFEMQWHTFHRRFHMLGPVPLPSSSFMLAMRFRRTRATTG